MLREVMTMTTLFFVGLLVYVGIAVGFYTYMVRSAQPMK